MQFRFTKRKTMLKLKLTKADGSPLYVMGLSAMNIERLQAGMPIPVHLREFGGQGEVLIFAGETEDAMIDELVAGGMLKEEAAEAARAAMHASRKRPKS